MPSSKWRPRAAPSSVRAVRLFTVPALLLTACSGGGGGASGATIPPPDPHPSELRFEALQNDVAVVQAGRFEFGWAANDVDDDATVSIFADGDGDIDTTADRITLVDEVAESNGEARQIVIDLSTVPAGRYAILGRVRDGKGGELRVTAPGRLIVEDRALIAPFGGSAVEIAGHVPRADGSFDVVGRYRGPVELDARHRLNSTSRTWDAFVAHHTARGVIDWLTLFECTGDMEPTAIVRAPNGDLLITGAFGGTLTMPDSTTVRGRGDDAFVARLAAGGAVRWVRVASSPNRDIGTDIALLADGSFAVVGAFNIGNTTYGIDFGNDANGQPVSLSSAGIGDAFVVRYDRAGVPLWARSIGGSASERARAVTVLDGDQIVVGGSFEGTVAFGDAAVQRTATGQADGFVSVWSKDGALARVDTFVGSGEEVVVDAVRCVGGDLVVLANSTSPVLDVAGQRTLTLATERAATLSRFAPNGALRWAHAAVVGPGPCGGDVLAPLADDGIVFVGTYADGARFGPTGPTLSAVGTADAFVSRLAADGAQVWLRRLSSADAETNLALSAHGDGSVLVTGDRGNAGVDVYTDRGPLTLAANSATTDFLVRLHPDGGLGLNSDLTRRIARSGVITRGNLSLKIDGLTATLEGIDETGTTSAITQLLDEYPRVALLVIQSADGPARGNAHLAAGLAIAAAGLETHVPYNGALHGGGIDLFVGGRRRTADDGANIRVRTWLDASGLSGYSIRDDRTNPAHQPYLDFYAAVGVPADYYWMAIATPRNTNRRLSRDELVLYRIVTD